MDQRATARQLSDDGSVTVQYIAATGFSLLLLALIANLITFQYGRAAVRAALDEGVRVGSRADGGATECERRAHDALDDLLGGALGDGVALSCTDTGVSIEAHATVTFASWAPLVPSWSFVARARAVREGR